MSLSVGYAQSTITPSLAKPVYLAGFGPNRRVQLIHDELYVRALALHSEISSNPKTLILVALDLIGLLRKYVLEIQNNVKAIFPDIEILIASTHTHHGPDTLGLWGPDYQTCGVDPEYIRKVMENTTLTVLDSLKNLRPSGMIASSITVAGVAKNTRDPEIVDQELSCLQFKSDDEILATLLVFPCHPEVLWEFNPNITSDYPGYLRSNVEQVTQAPCLFFAGALGGMMTPKVKDHSFQEAEVMGKTLAKAALNALEKPKYQVASSQSVSLELQKVVFSSPLTNPIYHMAIRAELLPNILDENNNITTEASLLKIGEVWFVSVPGELLPKLGLLIKDQLKRAGAELSVVLGLANDELGYILPDEDFVYPEDPFHPGNHYEETNSIGPNIGSILLANVQKLIRDASVESKSR